MWKKSKRHQAQGGAQKTAPGAVINNKAVCRAVDELWASKPGSIVARDLENEYDALKFLSRIFRIIVCSSWDNHGLLEGAVFTGNIACITVGNTRQTRLFFHISIHFVCHPNCHDWLTSIDMPTFDGHSAVNLSSIYSICQ